MLGAIKHGLTNLVNFSGRDARQTFWLYVLFVYLIVTAISMLAMLPMMAEMFSRMFSMVGHAGAGQKPDPAMLGIFEDMIGSIAWLTIATGVLMALLLAASLVRRLHDSDMPGWWALAPALIQAYSIGSMPRQMHTVVEMMRTADPQQLGDPLTMLKIQSTGLIGWVAIGLVIWFGTRKSSEGPNRFGDAPTRF